MYDIDDLKIALRGIHRKMGGKNSDALTAREAIDGIHGLISDHEKEVFYLRNCLEQIHEKLYPNDTVDDVHESLFEDILEGIASLQKNFRLSDSLKDISFEWMGESIQEIHHQIMGLPGGTVAKITVQDAVKEIKERIAYNKLQLEIIFRDVTESESDLISDNDMWASISHYIQGLRDDYNIMCEKRETSRMHLRDLCLYITSYLPDSDRGRVANAKKVMDKTREELRRYQKRVQELVNAQKTAPGMCSPMELRNGIDALYINLFEEEPGESFTDEKVFDEMSEGISALKDKVDQPAAGDTAMLAEAHTACKIELQYVCSRHTDLKLKMRALRHMLSNRKVSRDQLIQYMEEG